jgi:hypothetical protein
MERIDYNGLPLFVWHQGGKITGIEDQFGFDILPEISKGDLLEIEKIIEDEIRD